MERISWIESIVSAAGVVRRTIRLVDPAEIGQPSLRSDDPGEARAPRAGGCAAIRRIRWRCLRNRNSQWRTQRYAAVTARARPRLRTGEDLAPPRWRSVFCPRFA